ncbi:chemotaxis protein [Burkholderia sp. SRS-W-2-2016]|uniref:methyl-accepting chemotaxis protein n=1 Tax=Burkholderia sp. SRS-W-2-2016 TaxID=1926878 RepID=UPI00094B4EF7|nr:methyl-accepting chemotaxis protein [Burkholderia sp. SRS-W-2-2016]OLL31167.1 chemotaxis protein [Burkholderia sp. SRS-W-2-2016]
MRNNQPVTQREFDYSASDMLVSATDVKGRIQYCNPAFIAISGFSREELLGAPHNIVRHPDMPREAYADMWETIGAGYPWTALVKNRRKNGDHYWVCANVTPVVENGRTVGYLSVRTKPSRDEVKLAESTYARMREGTLRSHRLRRGQLVRTGFAGKLQALTRWSVGARLASGYAVAPLALLAVGAVQAGGLPPLPYWSAAAISALLAGLAWFTLSRQVGAPLAGLSSFATRMAAGDLTVEMSGARHGDFADVSSALNQLKANLGAIVLDVRGQIGGVIDAAGEMSSGNADLARRTEMQAASLEETAATMEQFTTTVKANADAAASALALAKEAQDAAALGGEIVGHVERTMSGITSASQRIADITGVIDGIAFQTNIIALNAAVEAARAGDAGRSFAVVATEVRMLAQRCAESARQIKSVVDLTVAEVSQGTGLIERTTSQMKVIDDTVRRVLKIIDDVSNASDEQAKGITQVNQAITHLDSATQQNAALVEQAAATAQRLIDSAHVLDETVRLFTVAKAPA